MSSADDGRTLKQPTAAEVKQLGPLRGHCVLCQEPVHSSDLRIEPTLKKPMCCERDVPDEWRAAFKNKSSVMVCFRHPKECTDNFRAKQQGGVLVPTHGIDAAYATTLCSQAQVLKALKGKIDPPEIVPEEVHSRER